MIPVYGGDKIKEDFDFGDVIGEYFLDVSDIRRGDFVGVGSF